MGSAGWVRGLGGRAQQRWMRCGLSPPESSPTRDQRRRTESPDGNILLSVRAPVLTAMGSIIMRGAGPLIRIDNTVILAVSSTDIGGIALDARLFDSHGKECVVIVHNELKVLSQNWDVKVEGAVLTVWSAMRQIAMEIKFHPPHGIHVRRLSMTHRGWTFDTNDKGKIRITGQATIDFHQGAIVADGHIVLSQHDMKFTGPQCLTDAYDGPRFQMLSEQGQFERLAWEITEQNVYHVVNSPAGWHVNNSNGVPLGPSCTSREGAVALASKYLVQDPQSRVVVHNGDGSYDHRHGLSA